MVNNRSRPIVEKNISMGGGSDVASTDIPFY